MEIKKLIKDNLEDIKVEINKIIEENGDEMYKGVFDVIDKLKNDDDYWINFYKELKENYGDDEDDEIDVEYVNSILIDSVDRRLMELFGKKFKENLINLGYKYDKEGWDLKDKNNYMDLTYYGVIWNYWYDLDTCVRESVGDIFEMECNN